jgi:hypothetical protein
MKTITDETLVSVDGQEPCTWADFLLTNKDGLCDEDIAQIKQDLGQDGFCCWDWTTITLAP